MMGLALAVIIYLFMLWYKVWDIVPQEHKFWVVFALVVLALSEPATKVIIREKS